GRAKTARPSSRLLDPKTAALRLHQCSSLQKDQTLQNGLYSTRFDWRAGAICFGASPVAAVFGSAPGSATSPKHRIQLKPSPRNPTSKQDISTLRGLGHFYFALTLLRGLLRGPARASQGGNFAKRCWRAGTWWSGCRWLGNS